MDRHEPGNTTTELSLAWDFVLHFTMRLVSALEVGDWLDDQAELRGFCDRTGLEATPQRLDLVTDIAVVLGEYYRSRGTGWETPENLEGVPRETLVSGLERYGWRRAFLDKPVGE